MHLQEWISRHYIFLIKCKDGRITHWNETLNPLEAMKQNYGNPRPEKVLTDS